MFHRGIVAVFAACASAAAPAQSSEESFNLFDGIEPIVHLRTYYWDGQSTADAQSKAWAIGRWAGFYTRWYGDILQLGALGYTSQKLYGPSDKGGSQLLGPNQDPINVLGQAFASLRYAGQTFTAYLQLIDQPCVNPYDTRTIPNLFEAYLLSGKIADVDYIGGYVTKFKPRDAEATNFRLIAGRPAAFLQLALQSAMRQQSECNRVARAEPRRHIHSMIARRMTHR
jgi:hypothetical protein